MILGAQQGLAFVAGALTTLSPCVLPILPLVLGAAAKKDRFASIFIAAGLVTSFTAIGWSLASFGSFFGLSGDTVRMGGALFLGIFGITMLSDRLLLWFASLIQPLADKASRRMNEVEGATRGQNFLVGALLGIVWSPCSGPTLGAAVALAAQGGSGLESFGTMLIFSLGAAAPLCLVAYGAGAFLRKNQGRFLYVSSLVKKGFGAVMIIIAAAVLTGSDRWIEARITSIMPDSFIHLITSF